MSSAGRLGLVAGGGDLPVRVAARCEAEARALFVVRLKGFASDTLARFEGIDSGLGEFGRTLSALRDAGCREVCFAGTVSRPDFSQLKPDLKGATVLPGLIKAATRGDDALLRQVLSVFEAEGFAITGADDLLGGDTLGEGPLGRVRPNAGQGSDIAKALQVARMAGEMDIGQGAVVCRGLVLAVEAQEGTDAMLERVAALPEALRGRDGAREGVLVKAPKPGQDRRVDLPVIGVRTLENAARAGLAGVAGEAGGLIVIEPEAVREAADRLGLFVAGVS
jgi:UDP-2,3-diacylglucosamine hydrolase